jgi:hypothetical protein
VFERQANMKTQDLPVRHFAFGLFLCITWISIAGFHAHAEEGVHIGDSPHIMSKEKKEEAVRELNESLKLQEHPEQDALREDAHRNGPVDRELLEKEIKEDIQENIRKSITN